MLPNYPDATLLAESATDVAEYFEGSGSVAEAVQAGWTLLGIALSYVSPNSTGFKAARAAAASGAKSAKASFFRSVSKAGKNVGSINWLQLLAEVLALLEQYLNPPVPA
jgi:hypothetical protein